MTKYHVIIALLCLFSPPETIAQSDSLSFYINKAKEALEHQDYDEAITFGLKSQKNLNQLPSEAQMEVHMLMADIYQQLDAPALSLEHRLIHYQSGKTKKEGPLYEYFELNDIATLYMRIGNYAKAAYYFDLGKHLADSIQDVHLQISSLNNLGFLEENRADLDAALEYYNSALNLFPPQEKLTKENKILYHFIIGNIGNIQFRKGQFETAIQNIQTDIDYTWNLITLKEQANICVTLIFAHAYLKQFIKAQNTYSKLQKISQKDSSVLWQTKLLSLVAEKNIKRQQLDQTLEIYEQIVKDKNDHQQFQKKQIQVMQQYQINLAESKLKSYENEILLQSSQIKNTRLKYSITILIILFVLLILGAYLRIKNRTLRRKIEVQKAQEKILELEIENKQMQQQHLEQEIHYKNKDLRNFALDANRKNESHKKILKELNQIKKELPAEYQQNIKLIIQDLKMQGQVNDKINLIQNNINQINEQFYEALFQYYPNINSNEKLLCSFVKLGLKDKEIAQIRNVSPKSVKMARYRLKKKFKLQEDNDLYTFLNQL